MGTGPVADAGVHRFDPPGVDHGARDPLQLQALGGLDGHLDHAPDREDHRVVALAKLFPAPDRKGFDRQVGRRGNRPLRVADRDRPVGGQRGLEQRAQLGGVLGRDDLQVGDEAEVGQVEDAVMRGAIRTGDAGAVDHEHDGQLVERHVHDGLVEGAGQERRIDADDRMHAREREAGRERDRVLLADAHVEEAVGKLLGEVQQSRRRRHRGGDRAHLRAARRGRHQGLAEDVRVGHLGGPRAAGERVEGADPVQLVDLVVDRRAVAVTFLCDHVHHHRLAQLLRPVQDFFERSLVMAVDEARVLDAQALEHGRGLEQLLQAFLDAVRGLVRRRSHERKVAQQPRDVVLDALVARVHAQLG